MRMKAQHFHTKLPCQKSMLRQIECGVHNGPITKDGLLLLTTSLFLKIFIFILYVSASVLFECRFSF